MDKIRDGGAVLSAAEIGGAKNAALPEMAPVS
jgi:hypothetical protein